MERRQASEYPQELLNLFDRYVHGEIDRRDFLEGAKKFAVGGVTATAIWESLRPNYAWAQQVPKDDSRIKTEYVTVPSPEGNGSIKGYLVRPAKAAGKLPGVLVVHENRGLNPYIEDVARRLGTANFIAFAPDGLTSVGGYPGDDEKGGAAFAQGGPREDDRGFRGVGALAEGAAGLHRQDRRGGLLLRRRHRQHAGRPHGQRPAMRRFLSMADSRRPRTSPRSRRRCCCSTRRWTRASPADGRRTRRP